MPAAATHRSSDRTGFALGAAASNARRMARQVLRRPFHSDYRLLSRLHPAPGHVFVDAGAFDGAAVEAMRLYHPDTSICAFEPNPRRAHSLAERFAQDSALQIYRCGLSSHEADAALAVPVRAGRIAEAEASFDARRVQRWDDVRWLETRLFPLDALRLDVSVLKVAVNGLERSVLEGARRTLLRCEPLVLCALDEAADAFLTGELGWMRAAFDGARLIPGEAGNRHAVYAGPRCEAELWRAGLVA
jgi:FkbM family methyltransferase